MINSENTGIPGRAFSVNVHGIMNKWPDMEILVLDRLPVTPTLTKTLLSWDIQTRKWFSLAIRHFKRVKRNRKPNG